MLSHISCTKCGETEYKACLENIDSRTESWQYQCWSNEYIKEDCTSNCNSEYENVWLCMGKETLSKASLLGFSREKELIEYIYMDKEYTFRFPQMSQSSTVMKHTHTKIYVYMKVYLYIYIYIIYLYYIYGKRYIPCLSVYVEPRSDYKEVLNSLFWDK